MLWHDPLVVRPNWVEGALPDLTYSGHRPRQALNSPEGPGRKPQANDAEEESPRLSVDSAKLDVQQKVFLCSLPRTSKNRIRHKKCLIRHFLCLINMSYKQGVYQTKKGRIRHKICLVRRG